MLVGRQPPANPSGVELAEFGKQPASNQNDGLVTPHDPPSGRWAEFKGWLSSKLASLAAPRQWLVGRSEALRTQASQASLAGKADVPRGVTQRSASILANQSGGAKEVQTPAMPKQSESLRMQAHDIFNSYMAFGCEAAGDGQPFTPVVSRDQLDPSLLDHFTQLWKQAAEQDYPKDFFTSMKTGAFAGLLEQRAKQPGGLAGAAITPGEMRNAIAQAAGCRTIEGRTTDEAYDLFFRDCLAQVRDATTPGSGAIDGKLLVKMGDRLLNNASLRSGDLTRIKQEALEAVMRTRREWNDTSDAPPTRNELMAVLGAAVDKVVKSTRSERQQHVERGLAVAWHVAAPGAEKSLLPRGSAEPDAHIVDTLRILDDVVARGGLRTRDGQPVAYRQALSTEVNRQLDALVKDPHAAPTDGQLNESIDKALRQLPNVIPSHWGELSAVIGLAPQEMAEKSRTIINRGLFEAAGNEFNAFALSKGIDQLDAVRHLGQRFEAQGRDDAFASPDFGKRLEDVRQELADIASINEDIQPQIDGLAYFKSGGSDPEKLRATRDHVIGEIVQACKTMSGDQLVRSRSYEQWKQNNGTSLAERVSRAFDQQPSGVA